MSKPIIIGLAGAARVGKDTAADFLCGALSLRKTSFADPLKTMLKVGLGLSDAQLYGELKEVVDTRYGKTPRYMMQVLGTEWGRDLVSGDIWVQAMAAGVEQSMTTDTFHRGVVIPDVRFDNEAKWIRENGILIHLYRTDRPGIDNADHISEKPLERIHGDHAVFNNGSIPEFHARLHGLMVRLGLLRESIYA